jgi:hypothetical protein
MPKSSFFQKLSPESFKLLGQSEMNQDKILLRGLFLT